FVFGPINSGKTELILNLINGIDEDYSAFYINLRWRVLSNYKDFARS
ncbi:MAG TPA: ATP-binding protein, partial [Methanosarcinales archaeon]|nr:ATP-binding protein [Methanosarcinales archaeon]